MEDPVDPFIKSWILYQGTICSVVNFGIKIKELIILGGGGHITQFGH